MRKHSYSKTFKAILLSLAPTLVNVRVRRDVRVLNLFLVVFQFMLYSLFFSGVKTFVLWYLSVAGVRKLIYSLTIANLLQC